MVRFRVFMFFAITLCFVASLCVQATVSKDEAMKAVHNAKRSTKNTLNTAERELKEAQNVKRDMEWYEKKAEKRVSEADAVAAEAVVTLSAAKKSKAEPALTAAKENKTETETVARNKRFQLKNARSAYPNAKNDTDKAIKYLSDVILKALQLDKQLEIEVLPETDLPIDYTNVCKTALRVKTEAEELVKQIEKAKTLLSGAKAIIWLIPAPTKDELIEKHKADGLSAFTVFDTIVGDADFIVQNIEYRKNEVNISVETIKKILNINHQKLFPHVNRFLTTAQDDLVMISQTFRSVHQAKQNIMQWKQHAEKSKEMLNVANNETTAKQGLRFIKFYADNSESEFKKIKEAMESAEQSVKSAHNQVSSASEEIFKHNITLSRKVEKKTKKPRTVIRNTKIRPQKIKEERKTQDTQEEFTEEATEVSTSQEAKGETDHDKNVKVEETTLKPTNNDAVQLTDLQEQEHSEEETTTPTSKAGEVHIEIQPVQFAEETTTPKSKTSKETTDIQPDQLREGQITKPISEDAERQTESQPVQSAEETTSPASKTPEVPTDNKPDQFTEQQIKNTMSKDTDEHTESQKDQSTEEAAPTTIKNLKVPTDNKPDQFTEQQIKNTMSKDTDEHTESQKDQSTEEATPTTIKNLKVHTDNQLKQFTEKKITKPIGNNADGQTVNKQEQTTEETTTSTSKTPEVTTDNKPDQLTEEQITNTINKDADAHTESQPEQSEDGDTEPTQDNATVKSIMINPAKEKTGISAKSAHQASDQPDLKEEVQPKDKKSEVFNLDKLRKSKKNTTNIPFFGENVPASGTWSDGSIILSVPLLAALIASAVLH